MTIHHLSNKHQQNDFGESPLPYAPEVTLSDGSTAVPQQFLDVQRTLESLENILSQIEFSDKYPLFAGRQGDTVFLQVGLIGTENYPNQEQKDQMKTVYGRRWMLEPTTPTSEVVQTALLAIKKAREHELREKLKFTSAGQKHTTTPFNSHQDLPLMASKAKEFLLPSQFDLSDALNRLTFSSMRLCLSRQIELSRGQSLAEIDLLGLCDAEPLFPEMVEQRLAVVYSRDDINSFLHSLIAELVHNSDRYIEENLSFKGFARFSHTIDVASLADFSYRTRNIEVQDERFEAQFSNMSYAVDSAKTPEYASGELGRLQRRAILNNNVSQGYLPTEREDQPHAMPEPLLLTVS